MTFWWSQRNEVCLCEARNTYIFLRIFSQRSRLNWCDRGEWGDGGRFPLRACLELLYICTLPSHQYNLECCKNFWAKIYWKCYQMDICQRLRGHKIYIYATICTESCLRHNKISWWFLWWQVLGCTTRTHPIFRFPYMLTQMINWRLFWLRFYALIKNGFLCE